MSVTTEKLREIIQKHPISIGCGVVALVLLGIVYFRSGAATAYSTELEQKTAEASRLAMNLKNSTQLKEHLEAVVAAGKGIEGRMIKADDLTTNRQYFYRLESDTGIKLLDLRQSPSTKKDAKSTYTPTAFSVNVQGEYTQLLTFLRQLERGPRFCRVLSASCNSAPERGQLLVLSLSLELLGTP